MKTVNVLSSVMTQLELGHLIHEFKYSKVPYGPLTVEKAIKCLYTLLNAALEQLHHFGVAHNDVRLENIL